MLIQIQIANHCMIYSHKNNYWQHYFTWYNYCCTINVDLFSSLSLSLARIANTLFYTLQLTFNAHTAPTHTLIKTDRDPLINVTQENEMKEAFRGKCRVEQCVLHHHYFVNWPHSTAAASPCLSRCLPSPSSVHLHLLSLPLKIDFGIAVVRCPVDLLE